MIWVQGLLVLFLLLLFYEDVKNRSVPIIYFVILFLLVGWLQQPLWFDVYFYISLLINVLIVGIQLLVIYIYLRFLRKPSLSLFEAIGWGDFLVLGLAAVYFESMAFLWYEITGICFSLLLHLVLNRFQSHQTVPLAGYLGIWGIFYVGFGLDGYCPFM